MEDGELLSSEEREDEREEQEESASKRLKLDNEDADDRAQEEEGDGGEWMTVVRGPKPKTVSEFEDDSIARKRKRNRMKSYTDDVLGEATPPLASSDQSKKYLTVHQAQLLNSLTKPHEVGGVNEVEYKTADVQAVLLHLLLGYPEVRRRKKAVIRAASLSSQDDLVKKKVIVVWLSNFSRHDCISNSESFTQLKSLPFPQASFDLKNPGTDKFVTFGLEAFMEIETGPNFVKKPEIMQKEFTRKDCLLSYQQLVENEYPLPQTDSGMESSESDFMMLGTWPNQPLNSNIDSTYPIFAIDCEMVKTEAGSELARISVINESLACIYTSLVKPDNPVVDYLTRYSGVTEEMLQDVTVRLCDVQAKLSQLLPPNSILVGHSLENDLLALKMYHPFVIDTSMLFAPLATPRSKPGLRLVAKKLLKKSIQMKEAAGHDPTEDAMTCMELVKKKLQEGADCVIEWKEFKLWLPVHLAANGVSHCVIDKQSMASLYTGRVETSYQAVTSDQEAVDKVLECAQKNNFIFTQLHSMEVLKKSTAGYTEEEFKSTLSELDKLCCDIVSSSPPDSIIMIICGSGHIGEVRELQKDSSTSLEVLKTAVMKAREGRVFALLK